MRLQLLSPPVLVGVADGGVVHPALLLATRGDRRYVQLSRGAGQNHLRWVAASAVGPVPEQVPAGAPAPGRGLPWVVARAYR